MTPDGARSGARRRPSVADAVRRGPLGFAAGAAAPAAAARDCEIENGDHRVGRPQLVDGRRIRGTSGVTFPCAPEAPAFPYDHATIALVIKQYRGLGFWASKSERVVEFDSLHGEATVTYDCDGDGSQLYQVVSVLSIDLKGEDGPFPGGTWFKESAEVRLRC